jgi:hypothetical protein
MIFLYCERLGYGLFDIIWKNFKGKKVISKDIICDVKRDKFYRAVKGVDIMNGYLSIFYILVIYFRYRSFIKCTESQEERDLAYVAFYKAKGNMWGGIILGIFLVLLLGVFIIAGINHSNI